VIGIDNHNDYYDPALKEARLARHADHLNYKYNKENLLNEWFFVNNKEG
jgi:UDP-glucuronate 4-epimerase